MTSSKKTKANQRNAQSSTGPADTSRTRLNALKHGILSNEALIKFGDGTEDNQTFESLRRALWEALAPVGALEELLAEKMITCLWRQRRVVSYEAAVASRQTITVLQDREEEDQSRRIRKFLLGASDVRLSTTEDLATSVDEAGQELAAVQGPDPLGAHPGICSWATGLASEMFDVPVEEILGWDPDSHEDFDATEYAQEDIQKVIDDACRRKNCTEQEFWHQVRADVQEHYDSLATELEERRSTSKTWRLSASLPDERTLAKIQRYESHLSREFYKALHELQRLQAARIESRPLAPMAVDVAVDVNDSKSGSEGRT